MRQYNLDMHDKRKQSNKTTMSDYPNTTKATLGSLRTSCDSSINTLAFSAFKPLTPYIKKTHSLIKSQSERKLRQNYPWKNKFQEAEKTGLRI